MGVPVGETFSGKILMKDAYRDSYGMALLYAHREDLKDSTRSVADLMNDYSPASMDSVENI